MDHESLPSPKPIAGRLVDALWRSALFMPLIFVLTLGATSLRLYAYFYLAAFLMVFLSTSEIITKFASGRKSAARVIAKSFGNAVSVVILLVGMQLADESKYQPILYYILMGSGMFLIGLLPPLWQSKPSRSAAERKAEFEQWKAEHLPNYVQRVLPYRPAPDYISR